ncbi:MAG: RsmD family RNA methyltransferase, partial [Bacteroidales bacterium]|nr:RsmD family RNA methyltransferase [Bacteroidales bacterium]
MIIKEIIFSSIQNFIEDSLFLELFCGSGNIGLEAISRGAKKVWFVDNSVNSIKVLKKILDILRVE